MMTFTDGLQFWEGVYRDQTPSSCGRPGKLVSEIVGGLAPCRALELGCAKGDDAVWLARQGWDVLAVDISSAALSYAAANAKAAGISDRIIFAQHDLARSFPDGCFDLVVASFLYSPAVDFTRTEVLRRAADAVAAGGHLLIVDHGSRAPWSWSPADTIYSTAQETLASLELRSEHWKQIRVEPVERMATGPRGETAPVLDNLIFIQHC